MAGNIEQVDHRVIRCGNLFLSIQRTAHIPFHVGLSRADPNLAYQHLLDSQSVLAFDFQSLSARVRLQGVKFDHPLPIITGSDRFALRPERDGDTLTGIGPAPNGRCHFLLQDHPVTDDGGKGNVRTG